MPKSIYVKTYQFDYKKIIFPKELYIKFDSIRLYDRRTFSVLVLTFWAFSMLSIKLRSFFSSIPLLFSQLHYSSWRYFYFLFCSVSENHENQKIVSIQAMILADLLLVPQINLFHVIGLFLYPLKKSESQRFSDVFRGYKIWPVAWNDLMVTSELLYTAHNYTTLGFFIYLLRWVLTLLFDGFICCIHSMVLLITSSYFSQNIFPSMYIVLHLSLYVE